MDNDQSLEVNKSPKNPTKRKSSLKDIMQINSMINNLPIMRSILKGSSTDLKLGNLKAVHEIGKEGKAIEEIFGLLKNCNRTKEDNLKLIKYLQTNKFVQKILAMQQNKNVEFLNALSIGLSYEKVLKNTVVMKYGDKGDKFYLIFQGQVSVLIPVKQIYYLTEEEYMKHLFALKNQDENGLIRKITMENRHVFDISEDDVGYIYSKIKTETVDKDNEQHSLRLSTKSVAKSGFFTKLINQRKELLLITKNNLRTTEDYIMQSIPVISKKDTFHSKVTLFIYKKVSELGSGEKFGDLAFKREDLTRSATIVAEETTHFGVLSRIHYQDIIREFQERLQRQNVQFLYNSNLFHSIEFVKKNYSHFLFVTFNRGENLITQGEVNEYIYFLQCGDYEVKLKVSYKELHDLSKVLNCNMRNDNNIDYNQSDFVHDYGNENSKKWSNRTQYSIFNINDSEILGLEFGLESNQPAMFTVTCRSSYADGFKIAKSIFKQIIHQKYDIQDKVTEFSISKKLFIEERVQKLIDGYIMTLKRKSGNNSTFENFSSSHKLHIAKSHFKSNSSISQLIGKGKICADSFESTLPNFSQSNIEIKTPTYRKKKKEVQICKLNKPIDRPASKMNIATEKINFEATDTKMRRRSISDIKSEKMPGIHKKAKVIIHSGITIDSSSNYNTMNMNLAAIPTSSLYQSSNYFPISSRYNQKQHLKTNSFTATLMGNLTSKNSQTTPYNYTFQTVDTSTNKKIQLTNKILQTENSISKSEAACKSKFFSTGNFNIKEFVKQITKKDLNVLSNDDFKILGYLKKHKYKVKFNK